MHWHFKDIFRDTSLHHNSILHDHNTIRNFAHDPKIMCDKQKAQPLGALQICQKLQYLRLNGHVQCGCRLICNQQNRFIGQGHGDHYPLPLATGQLMRIGFQTH